jgi:hypothetical protein
LISGSGCWNSVLFVPPDRRSAATERARRCLHGVNQNIRCGSFSRWPVRCAPLARDQTRWTSETGQNQVRCAAITYIPMCQGFPLVA